MLYLFDANVLITAKNTYYPIDQIPEYWEWLQFQGSAGNIKPPLEIMEEILAGKSDDPLLTWINDAANKEALLLDEVADPNVVNGVVESGYAKDLTDDEIEEVGRDPFLIAYGLSGKDRCVVTTEVSAPSKKRQNRRALRANIDETESEAIITEQGGRENHHDRSEDGSSFCNQFA